MQADPRETTTPEQPGELPDLPKDPSVPAGPNDIPRDNPDDERRHGDENERNGDDQAAAVAEIVGVGV